MKYRKKKCCQCGKMATWYYVPGRSVGNFYCDDCVPRGCTCNIRNLKYESTCTWEGINPIVYYSEKDLCDGDGYPKHCTLERKEDSVAFEILDDDGRRFPCVEYEFNGNGFKFKDNIYGFTYDELVGYVYNPYYGKLEDKIKNKMGEFLDRMKKHITKYKEIGKDYIDSEYVEGIDYNKIMPELSSMKRYLRYSYIGNKADDYMNYLTYMSRLKADLRENKRLLQDNLMI